MVYQRKAIVSALVISALFGASITYSPIASADKGAECAIWLCLPTGFGSGCSAAKRAFKYRIKHFKPPLPSFASCLVKGGGGNTGLADDFTSKEGFAAYIPTHDICSQYEYVGHGRERSKYCVSHKTIPARYVMDTRCVQKRQGKRGKGPSQPTGCVETVRYVQVLTNGLVTGETTFF